MTGTEVLNFIKPEVFVLVPTLIFIGLMLKDMMFIKDWTIPIILGVLGIVLAIFLLGFEQGFTGPIILSGIVQGVLCAGMAVYIHQLTIQVTRKRDE